MKINADLNKEICNNLYKTQDYKFTKDDLKSITEICFNKYNLIGKEKDIKLEDLLLFSNLEKCIIANFDITDKDLKIFKKFKNLTVIQFSSCNFEKIENVKNIKNKKIILDNCK